MTDDFDHCGGKDPLCTCLCGKPHTMTADQFQSLERGRECEACRVSRLVEEEEAEPPCICAEWDARGWSVCGIPCSVHPPEGKCPTCEKKTHKNLKCIACAIRAGEYV